MNKNTFSGLTGLLILALQARAQLLSCADISTCPMNIGISACKIEGTLLSQIGVANFSSALSPNPISWSIGYAPELSADSTDGRKYYLGTPEGLDLGSRTDVDGCALFFTGIEAGLSFIKPNETGLGVDRSTSTGTCADALGSTCESDLTSQAQGLVGNSTLQCSELASILQSSPPKSCTKAGTWGNITAKGSSLPSPVQLDNCNPTGNGTYSVREIVSFPTIGELQPSSYYITPLMTIFMPNDNATGGLTDPEVHLSCMKPVLTESPNKLTQQGGARAVRVQNSLLSIPIAVIGGSAMAILMA